MLSGYQTVFTFFGFIFVVIKCSDFLIEIFIYVTLPNKAKFASIYQRNFTEQS